MSKQMTREDLIAHYELKLVEAELNVASGLLEGKEYLDYHVNRALRARATLELIAPEPRTEKPGVEVGERIWMYWESAWDWQLMDTEDAILNWDIGSAPWLPYSALPMPKATDGTATFEKGEGNGRE